MSTDENTIAEQADVVTCRGGLLVKPNYTIADHPPLDITVIPGGYGTEPLMGNRARCRR